jgi:hypothetical protein
LVRAWGLQGRVKRTHVVDMGMDMLGRVRHSVLMFMTLWTMINQSSGCALPNTEKHTPSGGGAVGGAVGGVVGVAVGEVVGVEVGDSGEEGASKSTGPPLK